MMTLMIGSNPYSDLFWSGLDLFGDPLVRIWKFNVVYHKLSFPPWSNYTPNGR